jgi:hypothetical protein
MGRVRDDVFTFHSIAGWTTCAPLRYARGHLDSTSEVETPVLNTNEADSQMRKLFLAAAITAMASCGASPQQLCTDIANITCDRFFECATDAQKTANVSLFGADLSACKTKLAQDRQCATYTNEESACGAGQTFSAANASSCVSEYRAATCVSLESVTPEVCERICTASASEGG